MKTMNGDVERRVHAAIDLIAETPFTGNWAAVASAYAECVGGWGGQIVAVDKTSGALLLNAHSNFPDELVADYEREGGADPSVNPRTAAIMRSQAGSVVCEADFIDEDTWRKTKIYRALLAPWDGPFSCSVKVMETPTCVVGMAGLRSAKEGHADAAAIAAAQVLTPHLRHAISLSLKLGVQIHRGVLRSLDVARIPAFVCDRSGRVIDRNTHGEDVAAREDGVTIRRGHLAAAHESVDTALLQAIVNVGSNDGAGPPVNILLRTQSGQVLGAASIASLPREGDFAALFGHAVLVTLPRVTTHAAHALRQFGLTQAEGETAGLAALGHSIERIALIRDVSPHTARAQLRSAYAKLGVTCRAELAALVSKL